jgi:hypothetical protein
MILSLAACGEEQAQSPSAGKPSATTSVQPSGEDSLTIEVKASAQAPAKTWTLSCDPAKGDHPKAQQACATLDKTQAPFKPVPPGQMCTKIYGGPEIATVKGTWRNERINAKFTRADGCELSRWSKVAPLFGDVPKVR